jgi:hypothetical protein
MKCQSIGTALWNLTAIGLIASVHTYLQRAVTAGYVLFMERKRIEKLSPWQNLWYCLTFPAFETIGKISCLVALFTRVEWKPIPHKVSLRREEIQAGK